MATIALSAADPAPEHPVEAIGALDVEGATTERAS